MSKCVLLPEHENAWMAMKSSTFEFEFNLLKFIDIKKAI